MGVEIRDYRVYLLLIKSKKPWKYKPITSSVSKYTDCGIGTILPGTCVLTSIYFPASTGGKTTILNRSVNYLEQTSGEVKSDEKNGVHVYFDNPAATFIPMM